MRRSWLLAIALALPATAAHVTLAGASAATTIAVNALDIKATAQKALKASRAVKRAAAKTAKKVIRKK